MVDEELTNFEYQLVFELRRMNNVLGRLAAAIEAHAEVDWGIGKDKLIDRGTEIADWGTEMAAIEVNP